MKTTLIIGIPIILFGSIVTAFNIPVHANSEIEPTLVLPDSYFISQECKILRDKTRVINPQYYSSVERLCKSYILGEISGDQWLKQIAPIEQHLISQGGADIPARVSAYPRRASSNSTEPSLREPPDLDALPEPSSREPSLAEPSSREPSYPQNDGPIFPVSPLGLPTPRDVKDKDIALAIESSNPNLEPVPQGKNYQAYTLFLVPSLEWEEKNRKDQLQSLHKEFDAFGGAIGDKKVAIWLSDRSTHDIDINRSKYYCDKFKLSYSNGPYVVVTQKRPDEVNDGDKIIVIKLSGISEDGMIHVLNILEQGLRTNEPPSEYTLLFSEVRERMLTSAKALPKNLVEIFLAVIK